mmetsp:Transcript_5279/g.16940  ORF Transcript_5279/g.16940 Transcript_5279/m.16940 type:complete len:221 (-) Transcript_5279:379-1041(-)
MTAIRVSERVNEFASTRVSADWRKGMWTCCRPASVATHWRMHSCSTCSDALISAPSLRRSELCVAESSFLSEPAQSTRVSTAAGGRRFPAHGPSAADEQSSSVQTAWERDETALAPVACVARRDFAVASAASSSLEEVKSAEESPNTCVTPLASLASISSLPRSTSKSTHRSPRTSKYCSRALAAAQPAGSSVAAATCSMPAIVCVLPEPVAPYAKQAPL